MQAIRPGTPLDTAKLLALGAIWGSAFLCIEVAIRAFQPLTLAAVRVALAALLLMGLARLGGQRLPRDFRTWRRLTAIGVTAAGLPFALISWGQQEVPAGTAAILMGAGPFVALLLNHLYTADDRVTPGKVLGLLLGFAGVLLLVGVEGLSAGGGKLLSMLAILAAACSYALSGFLARGLSHLDPRMSAGAVLASATLYLFPLAFLLERPLAVHPAPQEVAALLFLGLISSGVAYLLRFQLIKETGAVFASQVAYLVPLFGVFWAWLFLKQQPGLSALGALVLILLGIAASRLRSLPLVRLGARLGLRRATGERDTLS